MYSLAFISLYLFEFMNHNLRSLNYSIGATSKLVSSSHALITGSTTLGYLMNYLPLIFFRHIVMLSIGYSIYDSYNLYRNNHKDRYVLYVHHFFIIVGIVYCEYYDNVLYYNLLAANYLAEISAIFINFTLFLYETKRTHFKLFHITFWLLLVTFFFTRILPGFWVIIQIYYIGSVLIYFQIVLTMMNLYWFKSFYQKYFKIIRLQNQKKIK